MHTSWIITYTKPTDPPGIERQCAVQADSAADAEAKLRNAYRIRTSQAAADRIRVRAAHPWNPSVILHIA